MFQKNAIKIQILCSTTFPEFNVHGSVHRNNILIYIQQDATLHSLFYLETALHVSGGTTTYHQERKQLYLQHLVSVRPLRLSAAIAYVILSSLTCPALPYFSTLSHKRNEFRKQNIEHKRCVLILSKTLV
jgi:hypothetical protein